MQILFPLFLFIFSAAAFVDHKRGLHLFSLPELQSPLQRHLTATGTPGWHYMVPTAEGAYPEVHEAHEFLGATRLGFVHYNMSAILKSTAVQSDDYLDLLVQSRVTCAPLAAASGRAVLTLAFAEGGPAGALSAAALEHLAQRLSQAEAVLVLGPRTLLGHPDLDQAGSCARHLGEQQSPSFAVAGAPVRTTGSLAVELSATHPSAAYSYLSLHLEFTPHVQQEVKRRRALGLPTGRSLGTDFSQSLGNFAINWNGNLNAPGAATPSIPIFPGSPGSPAPLACADCYFFLQARVVVSLKVCMILTSAVCGAGSRFYYDAQLPLALINTTNGYYYATPAVTTECPSLPFPGNPSPPGYFPSAAQARAETDCSAAPLSQLSDDVTFYNVGFTARAVIEGGAGFNFALQGAALSGTLAFPASCSGTVGGDACPATALPGLPPFALPPIVIPTPGLPVTISPTISLQVAAASTLAAPNSALSWGTSGNVNLLLGGSLQYQDTPEVAFAGAPESVYSATLSSDTLSLSGLGEGSGTLSVFFAPVINLAVWNGAFTFSLVPGVSAALAIGAMDSCTGGNSLQINANGTLGISLLPITGQSLLTAIAGPAIGALVNAFPAVPIAPLTVLLDPSTVTFSSAAQVCVPAAGIVIPGPGPQPFPGGAASAAPSSQASVVIIVSAVSGALLLALVLVWVFWSKLCTTKGAQGKNPALLLMKKIFRVGVVVDANDSEYEMIRG